MYFHALLSHLLLVLAAAETRTGADPDAAVAAAAAASVRGDHRTVVSLLKPRLFADAAKTAETAEAVAWLPLLAEACEATRDDDCAVRALEQVIKGGVGGAPPITALNGLGLILSRRKQHTRAVGLLRRACDVEPDNHGLWNNFGTVAHAAPAQIQLAVSSYKRAWDLSKRKVKVYGYNYANALMDAGRHAKAAKVLKRTSRLDKKFAEVWWKLGRCHVALGAFSKAARAFRRALKHVHSARKFNEAGIQFELHDALLGVRPRAKYAEAVVALERAVELEPQSAEYFFALLHVYRYTADYGGLERTQRGGAVDVILLRELAGAQSTKPSLSPMRALAFLDPPRMLALMRDWAGSMSPPPRQGGFASSPDAPGSRLPWWAIAGKRLRVGFLSSEWEKNSPMMHLVDRLPILIKEHGAQEASSSAVVVYTLAAFDTASSYPGATSLHRLRSAGVLVRSLHGISDADAAAVITEDRLHAIIDLTGYTAGGRPEILARIGQGIQRSAVLRMSYLGWPSTMGSTEVMDVAFGDAIATPIEMAPRAYAEKLVLMPRSFFFADHDQKMQHIRLQMREGRAAHRRALLLSSSPSSSSALRDAGRAFVFANFNQLFKLDDLSQLDVWANILRRSMRKRQRSSLWLLRHPAVAEPHVLEQFRARGIQTEKRILFSDFAPKTVYLVRSSAADLFLDNPKYNAGATGVDALYSQVPVLTLPTERTVGRMGASMGRYAYGGGKGRDAGALLSTMSAKAYEDVAVQLSKSRRVMRHLRKRLRTRDRGGLFDPKVWARDFRGALKLACETRGRKHVVVQTTAQYEKKRKQQHSS
jgi:protein O-GlcNAc transferase